MSDEDKLKKKAQSGIANVVEEILKQPQVQKAIVRQSLKTGFTMSFILLGGMELLNYAKTTINQPWVNLLTGTALLSVGLAVLVKDALKTRK